jgi:hypothetical protein
LIKEEGMAWEFSVLVVANVTATSEDLIAAMSQRSRQGACRFTLIVPSTGPESETRKEEALKRMREAGLEKVEGRVGDPDPVVAVMEIWDPRNFDEILVSTLPTDSSRWLGLDLPHRLEKLTSVTVRHVISQPRPAVHTSPPPPKPERHGVLAPLAAALKGRGK